MSNQRITVSLPSIFSISIVVLLILLFWHLKDLIILSMTAVVLAVTLAPAVDYIERRGLPRWAAVLLVYLSLTTVLVGFGLLVGPTVVQQTENLISQVPVYSEALYYWVRDLASRVNVDQRDFITQLINPQAIADWGLRSSQQLVLRSVGLTKGLVGGFLSLILVILLSAYMLTGSKSLLNGLIQMAPYPWNDRLQDQLGPVGERMAGFIQGRVLVSAILAVVITVGLNLLGMNEVALALGLIAGVTNLIPFVGPILGAIPAVVVAVSEGGLVWLWVLLLFVIVQNLEGNILTPLVVGSSVKLPPLYMLLTVIAGTQILGVLGALILPPWVSGVSVVVENLYLKPKAIAEAQLKKSGAIDPTELENSLTPAKAVVSSREEATP